MNAKRADSTTMTTGRLHIGWAAADLTPEKPVQLAGQFHARVSEGVLDPVTVTALSLSAAGTDGGETGVVLVSCDVVSIPDTLRDAVRAQLASLVPDLDTRSVILNATHTHTAPELRLGVDYQKHGGGISSMGMCVELPAMAPADYVACAAERIAGAVAAAWRGRAPGAISYGLGHAVVGRNRRSVYAGGVSRMYGNTAGDDFSHIEGYEDHSVNLLATYDGSGALSGVVVNVPCPSQVSEHLFQVSADYWHETRLELRKRLGAGLFVLPQCSPAGDQSPHVQWNKAAEVRMQQLSGLTQRQEIAVRIADAVTATLPKINATREEAPVFAHRVEDVSLARRRLSEADVQEALAEAEGLHTEYERLKRELDEHPELRERTRWYVPITQAYRRMMWLNGVKTRWELEQASPRLSFEAHVIRLGDLAFATNPFEYYLDFGICIKARSPAVQTFLVQLAGAGTYVPTERAVAGKSYGAVPASTPIGPEGGREMAEWTVGALKQVWSMPTKAPSA